MSLPDPLMFDALENARCPAEDLGGILPLTTDLLANFADVVAQAQSRMIDVFKMEVTDQESTIEKAEDVIQRMWQESWVPTEGQIAMFTRDFGSLVTWIIYRNLHPQLIFRSEMELIHLSCWWPEGRLEAFPFHKVYKRLSRPEGESLVFFYSALKRKSSKGG